MICDAICADYDVIVMTENNIVTYFDVVRTVVQSYVVALWVNTRPADIDIVSISSKNNFAPLVTNS